VVTRANGLATASGCQPHVDPLILLSGNPNLLSAHLASVPSNVKRRKGEFNADLLIAQAKVDDSDSIDEAVSILNEKEKFSILSNTAALNILMAKKRNFSFPNLSTTEISPSK
jgi:hypothetical protein